MTNTSDTPSFCGDLPLIFLGETARVACLSKILLVEDDSSLASLVKDQLLRNHYTVESVLRGDDALDLLAVSSYDLVIVDWNLPGNSGIEICQWLRKRGKASAILMLTSNATEDDKEKGLDCGADDYLTKPFGIKEFLARVRALLRRPQAIVPSDCLVHASYSLYPSKFQLERNGERIALQPQEFALLEFFFRNPNAVFSIETLLERVWKADVEATEDSLRGCLKRLRKKLNDPTIIENVHSIGYKLGTSITE